MGLERECLDDLFSECDADRHHAIGHALEEPVIPSSALAQAVTVPSEGHTGHDDDIDRIGVGFLFGNHDLDTALLTPTSQAPEIGLADDGVEDHHRAGRRDGAMFQQGGTDPLRALDRVIDTAAQRPVSTPQLRLGSTHRLGRHHSESVVSKP